ncbi:MAG: leucine-rich repeat domain-containing protein [Pirellulaceae bacterium]
MHADAEGCYRTAYFEGNDDQFQALCEVQELRELNCDYSSITDRVFDCIARLTELSTLAFIDTSITGGSFGVLKHLQSLTTIICNPKECADAAASGLADCPKLRIVRLEGVPTFSDSGIKQVLSLPHLEQLSLSDSVLLTDACLGDVWRCTRLSCFAVSRGNFGDIACAHLAECKTLRDICLGHTAVTGDGVAALGCIDDLSRLNLSGIPLTSNDLIRLGRCAKLERLSLMDTAIDDLVVDYLLALPALTSLNIVGTRVSPRGIEALSRRPWTMFSHD